MIRLRVITIRMLILMISEKKRFDKGTLLAPMQLPMSAQVAYWTPSVAVNRTAPIVAIIV